MENNKITSALTYKNVTYVLNLIDFFSQIVFNFIFTPTCFDFKLKNTNWKINNPVYCDECNAGDNEIIDQKLVCLKKKKLKVNLKSILQTIRLKIIVYYFAQHMYCIYTLHMNVQLR